MHNAISLEPLETQTKPKLEPKQPVPADQYICATCCFQTVLTGIKYCAHSEQGNIASVIKKTKKTFTHKYIPISDNVSTSKALVHTFYTLKTRLLLSAVRKCHVFLIVARKHQKQQQSDFNVSTNISAVYFFTLNWAAKVHELLTNLAVHGCRMSFLIMCR